MKAQSDLPDLPDRLWKWREREGLTQREAAATLGVPHRTYQGWEGGRRMPWPRLLTLALERATPALPPQHAL